MADVLAGDHRAAGGQRCHDLYHQGVEGVHKAHARHRRLAHRRHHEGIGQADGHAQGLLRNERQQQGRQLLAGINKGFVQILCSSFAPPRRPRRGFFKVYRLIPMIQRLSPKGKKMYTRISQNFKAPAPLRHFTPIPSCVTMKAARGFPFPRRAGTRTKRRSGITIRRTTQDHKGEGIYAKDSS